MKIMNLKLYLGLAFLIISLQLIDSKIGVGYITINMEGDKFIPAEYKSIKQLLNFASTTKKSHGIINEIQNAETEETNEANLDFILISIQESLRTVSNLNPFNKLLNQEEWTCKKIKKKTGLIKPTKALSTIFSLCHRNKFINSYSVDSNVNLFSTKFIAGYCFPIDDRDYCFLGGHLPVKVDGGAILLNKVIKKINKKKRDYIAYVVGDINTRTQFDRMDNFMEAKKILENDWRNYSPEAETHTDSHAYCPIENDDSVNLNRKENIYWSKCRKTRADLYTEMLFKEQLALQSKKTKKPFFRFVGNEQLHELPFTYKYMGDDFYEYNWKLIVDKARSLIKGNKQKVLDCGWLDRMICVSSNELDQSCRIGRKADSSSDLSHAIRLSTVSLEQLSDDSEEDRNDTNRHVNYFLVPFLKKGDHMPVLGFISIDA